MKRVRNEKRKWDGITYYEMTRVVMGQKLALVVAFTELQFEVGRAYIAHRLRESRAQLAAAVAEMRADA